MGKLVVKLVLGASAMFLFAIFVMPPLYDVFCEITGIGGKTAGPYGYVAEDVAVDESRTIRVQFVATNNGDMPWDFSPKVFELEVHPGQPTSAAFLARNPTGKPMVAQAIPSVSPGNATQYFLKTECFCFNRQPLGPGEAAELALVFIVDPDLPSAVNTITLSYTLFDVTDRGEAKLATLTY